MKKYPARKPARIPFTQEGYDKIIEEHKKFLAQRPDAVKHLALARAMGDLSENGYYKASRQRLSFVDAQIRRFERLIRYATIVESAHTGMVDIGSTVKISDGTRECVYHIVGGYESDPTRNTISPHSPIGQALMGRKAQDKVEVQAPSGIKPYTILSVS